MSLTRVASTAALVMISVVGFFGVAPVAKADDIHITAVVAGPGGPGVDPIVEFSGVAAPGATVTVKRNGTVLSSFPADSGANFNQTYTDQPTGQQIYEVSAVDTDGHTLAPLTFAVDLVVGTTTSLSTIFLGPSISLADASVMLNETISLNGQTYPLSDVTVTVATSPAQNFSGTANNQGHWTINVPANALGLGTFSMYARANSITVGLSELSLTVTVEVGAVVVTPPPHTNTNDNTNTTTGGATNTGTNANRNTNTTTTPPSPDPFAGKPRADLNGDGRVNLIDLSILLFYWQQSNPANRRADISNEGLVGMVDFSIMLFQWTG